MERQTLKTMLTAKTSLQQEHERPHDELNIPSKCAECVHKDERNDSNDRSAESPHVATYCQLYWDDEKSATARA